MFARAGEAGRIPGAAREGRCWSDRGLGSGGVEVVGADFGGTAAIKLINIAIGVAWAAACRCLL